ncbi:MAG: helix-turn-helix domain-containing protein [Melioribacteraceae bacterium]|nr:helix-turn-helix domain-containing protein [Melioribacteraceae bacterium]MCF8266339.1 helix-turn-helix domain-containing protein [Melioribacteraceae bacterium]MCF8414569.1 helix-turn-helix domain-containing protein [Melioribacteraceae bacterium]
MENRNLVVIETEQLIVLIKEAIKAELSNKNEIPQKELMNFKETCEFLGIHPSTLNKWKAENKIPFKRLGKRVFFEREKILKTLKQPDHLAGFRKKANSNSYG